jgi:diaminopimelate decarboxylase
VYFFSLTFLFRCDHSLPVNFDSEADVSDSAMSFADYAAALKKDVPELFSGEFRVITEFGRRYNAKAGFTVSQSR